MSLLKRLFGGGASVSPPESAAAVEYNGYRITPQPALEGGQYRVGALIEREVDGVAKTHHLIRADMIRDRTVAEQASVNKARQMIDQMGTRLFD